MHAAHPAAPDMLQDAADGDRARVDLRIDAERAHEAGVVAAVDEAQVGPAAELLCESRRQEVHLIVVGDGDQRFGLRDVGLPQDLLVERRAVQHDRAAELFGDGDGALAGTLDDLDAHVRFAFFERPGHVEADVAAARDDDAACPHLLVPENLQRAVDLIGRGDDVGVVALFEDVERVRNDELLVAHDRDRDGRQVGKQLSELVERRVEHRAVRPARDAEQRDPSVRERYGLERARQLQAPQNHVADLDLRRDDVVDRHAVAREQVGPARIEIALRADPRDFRRHVEERVRDLAGDHVDFVVKRHGDQHVRLGDARLLQDVGMGCISFDRAHFQDVVGPLHEFRTRVDDRDVVAFRRQAFGNAGTDLSGPADDHLHRASLVTVGASATLRLRTPNVAPQDAVTLPDLLHGVG